MDLALLMTDRCNASCAHCSAACGPRETTSLSEAQMLDLISQAVLIAGGRQLNLSLTGGEPFLNLPLLRSIVAHAAKLGARVACVSNAYWASTEDRASMTMRDLATDGLNTLAVSVSRFHLGFVNAARVRRALLAAKEAGIRTVLKCAVLRSDLDKAKERYWDELLTVADEVEHFAIVGPGRALDALDPDDLILAQGLPEGPCPSTTLAVAADGTAYICGASAPRSGLHRLGHIDQHNLAELRWEGRRRGTFGILRSEGPAGMARRLIAAGHGAALSQQYADVCDLCSHIARDPELSRSAEAIGKAEEVTQLNRMVDALLSNQPVRSESMA